MSSEAKNRGFGVSVVILTFNEEANLPHALQSVAGWSDDIHVVDSCSTDETLQIARSHNVHVHQNPWVNWAVQRNWAQDNCQLKHAWVLYLDADEQLTADSKDEILSRTKNASEEALGFYLQFEFYFLGRRVRNAMNPHLRLVRIPQVRWRSEGAREYCSAPKDSPKIKAHLIHKENRGMDYWSHNYVDKAKMEALYQFQIRQNNGDKEASRTKRPIKLLVREWLFSHCPSFLRAFPVFAYRLFFKTDLRDGWAGFVHAFFFGLWYPMLIDAMYIEICQASKEE